MPKLNEIPFLAVEGVIGVGKTSLVKVLAEQAQARLILESVEGNPFLAPFYRDPKRYAFQAQMFFLLSRYQQLSEGLLQPDMFAANVVSDYMFAKDRIFASVNLDPDEMRLYDTVAQALELKLPKPDFVLYLRSDTGRLLENIRFRGQEYESRITPEYLAGLLEAYDHFFFHYDDAPLLIIDVTAVDFVNNPRHLREIIQEIEKFPGGRKYFKPLGN